MSDWFGVVDVQKWRSTWSSLKRSLVKEVPIAFVYDGACEAVMMASPQDLEDFAVGFSVNDGVITQKQEILSIDVETREPGIELRITLIGERRERLMQRRRMRAGPAGCGICGVESISSAMPELPSVVSDLRVSVGQLSNAIADIRKFQPINDQTHASHAAGFYLPMQGMVCGREDVGRHNAMDKLCGALLRQDIEPAAGAVVVTSRLSVELVQKAAIMQIPVLIGISAPTDLAVAQARLANVTLVGVARQDGFEVFTHQWRISDET